MVDSAIHIIYVFTEFCLDLVSSAKRGVDSSKVMKLSLNLSYILKLLLGIYIFMTVVSFLVVKLLSLWNDPFYLWLYYVWHLIWSVIESPSFLILNCLHNIPFPSIYFQPICVCILKFIFIESIYLGLFLVIPLWLPLIFNWSI